jgi:hypothetical protein
MPRRSPELFEPIFCRVTRRRLCDGSGIEQARAAAVAPRRYAAISSSMRAGQGLCWTCLTGRGWPAQPRTSSIAQPSERLRARQKVRVEVPKLHRSTP